MSESKDLEKNESVHPASGTRIDMRLVHPRTLDNCDDDFEFGQNKEMAGRVQAI